MNNALLTFQPYLDEIDRVAKLRDLEELRVKILGKQGLLSQELKALGGHSPDMRKTLGAELNRLKAQFSQSIAERRQILQQAALREEANKNYVDVSLPLRPSAGEVGRIHPISQVTEEITAIFADMGFAVAEGPDIESDDNNFVALNFPEGHPSREMHDTFFLPEDEKGEQLLLRTHTSPVQIRTMRQQEPPIRVIIPGRTYRRDSDQTHTPMFHQVEGLVIDETSHLGHLKWLLEEFLRNFFEVKNLELRFRPSHFPFTEPSFEADMRCDRRANEVKLGEGDDWMEILGCGMVHPNVLSNCGLDPDRFQGFAWGVGIDRLAMLKYGLADLRTLFGGDVRWIDHYGFRPYNVPSLFSGLSPD